MYRIEIHASFYVSVGDLYKSVRDQIIITENEKLTKDDLDIPSIGWFSLFLIFSIATVLTSWGELRSALMNGGKAARKYGISTDSLEHA